MSVRFRRGNSGTIFVPSRGKPPEPPQGYVRDPGNPYRFNPEVVPEDSPPLQVYQHLYDDPLLKYGDANFNRCPGTRFLPLYEHWLRSPVFDFGCGRGHTVVAMKRRGFVAMGMDMVDTGSGMFIGDITQPVSDVLDYKTAISIDVFEHLLDEDLFGLIKNMQHAERQVISVHTGRAHEQGVKQDLHINKKSFEDWDFFLSKFFDVDKFERTGRQRGLFYCLM